MDWDLEAVHAEIDELQEIVERLHPATLGQDTYGYADACDRLTEIDRQLQEASIRCGALQALVLGQIKGYWRADREACAKPVHHPTLREALNGIRKEEER